MEAILLEKSSPQKMLIRFSAVRWSRAHRSLETHKAGLSTANYRTSNTNTKIQIHRCKYTNANTQIQTTNMQRSRAQRSLETHKASPESIIEPQQTKGAHHMISIWSEN